MSSDSTLQTLPDEGGGGTLSQYYKNLRGWFTKDRATVITWNATIIIILITLVSIIAAFIYGTFYYVYIPQTSLVRQLYFQKSQVVKDRVDVDGSTMKVVVEGLHTEVVLGDLQHFLRPGQSYNVELELDMPDSDVNQMAGTFMVSALFYDNKNTLLTSSSRLLMLKYRSWLLKILDTLFYAPLYLLDFSDQKQLRKVQLFTNYQESPYKRTSLISINIDNPQLQIYNAQLVLKAQFRGLKYYMYNWPLTTAVILITCIWYILFIITSSSWYALRSKIGSRLKSHSDSSSPGRPPNEDVLVRSEANHGNELAPKGFHTSLQSPERKTIDIGSVREDSGLGVTPIDSQDMMRDDTSIRRRIHTAEQSST